MSEISEAIQEMMKGLVKAELKAGTVVSVNKENDTVEIEPFDQGANHLEVKLKTIVDDTDTRFIIYPKIATTVYFAFLEGNEENSFVVTVGEFESILIEVKDKFKWLLKSDGKLEVDAVEIKHNGGNFGGIVKAPELALQIAKNTALLESIKAVFSAWVPVLGDGGTVLKVASAAFITLPTANLSNIKNDKIQH